MSGRKNDVLIIEDSMATTILLRDFLKKLGYENIEACTNGKTGIQVFSELESAGKKPIVLTGLSSARYERKRSDGKHL